MGTPTLSPATAHPVVPPVNFKIARGAADGRQPNGERPPLPNRSVPVSPAPLRATVPQRPQPGTVSSQASKPWNITGTGHPAPPRLASNVANAAPQAFRMPGTGVASERARDDELVEEADRLLRALAQTTSYDERHAPLVLSLTQVAESMGESGVRLVSLALKRFTSFNELDALSRALPNLRALAIVRGGVEQRMKDLRGESFDKSRKLLDEAVKLYREGVPDSAEAFRARALQHGRIWLGKPYADEFEVRSALIEKFRSQKGEDAEVLIAFLMPDSEEALTVLRNAASVGDAADKELDMQAHKVEQLVTMLGGLASARPVCAEAIERMTPSELRALDNALAKSHRDIGWIRNLVRARMKEQTREQTLTLLEGLGQSLLNAAHLAREGKRTQAQAHFAQAVGRAHVSRGLVAPDPRALEEVVVALAGQVQQGKLTASEAANLIDSLRPEDRKAIAQLKLEHSNAWLESLTASMQQPLPGGSEIRSILLNALELPEGAREEDVPAYFEDAMKAAGRALRDAGPARSRSREAQRERVVAELVQLMRTPGFEHRAGQIIGYLPDEEVCAVAVCLNKVSGGPTHEAVKKSAMDFAGKHFEKAEKFRKELVQRMGALSAAESQGKNNLAAARTAFPGSPRALAYDPAAFSAAFLDAVQALDQYTEHCRLLNLPVNLTENGTDMNARLASLVRTVDFGNVNQVKPEHFARLCDWLKKQGTTETLALMKRLMGQHTELNRLRRLTAKAGFVRDREGQATHRWTGISEVFQQYLISRDRQDERHDGSEARYKAGRTVIGENFADAAVGLRQVHAELANSPLWATLDKRHPPISEEQAKRQQGAVDERMLAKKGSRLEAFPGQVPPRFFMPIVGSILPGATKAKRLVYLERGLAEVASVTADQIKAFEAGIAELRSIERSRFTPSQVKKDATKLRLALEAMRNEFATNEIIGNLTELSKANPHLVGLAVREVA
ncbi:MAG TPA: hypothetical protein VHA82_12945 [Ramlibacter sp.]|uniref:hypothetical protein n=1 Tax=Ramlibacter sp. TaxID=1917967 RepID=UPI002CCDDD94|nr:hypothetical protein [Ramlibacter sp.]HVZ44710.1 hypothetical protein [Ramlibacter sp.]